MKDASITDLLGKVIKDIRVIKDDTNEDDSISFTISDEERYVMKHFRDCCESVVIDDICGDINQLIGRPVLIAEERTNHEDETNAKYQMDGISSDDSFTWTFYELATLNGAVTIRWYGSSNGYYSESVDFIRV